jgi:hypothetical protein
VAKGKSRAQLREEKNERLQRIIRLMTTPGAWTKGVTAARLADEYGVHQTTIDREAAEVSRMLRGSDDDREELRARVNAQVNVLVAMATKRSRITDALRGLELLSKNMGLTEQTIRLEQGERIALLEVIRGVADDETFDRIVAALGGGGAEGQEAEEDGRLH